MPHIPRKSVMRSFLGLVAAVILVATACQPNATATEPAQTPSTQAITTSFNPPTPPVPSGPSTAVQGATLTVPQIVKAVRPSVVHIQTDATQVDFFNRPIPVGGVGTGEIIDAKGNILTNNHVVEGARKIIVGLADGRTLQASLVGQDPSTDLAVIKIDADNLTPIAIGHSADLEVGESIVAIGHALDLPGGPTVTAGLVSALDRSIDTSDTVTIQHLIQTDAPINPGNSGGPLLNLRGEMVGINTAKIQAGEGISFAIAVDSAMPLVRELVAKGRIERGYLGVSLGNLTQAYASSQGIPVQQGIVVVQVVPGSPAEKAGLKRGIVIVGLAGKPIGRVADLESVLLANRKGDKVKIEYYDRSRKVAADITLGEVPTG